MTRRIFMKMFSLLPFFGFSAKEETKQELCELTTSDYKFVLRDFERRYPQHSWDLHTHSWMIVDLFFASKDESYPHYSLEISPSEFELKYGLRPTYFWRKHAKTARDLLSGKIYSRYELVEKKEEVTIYKHDWDDEVIDLTYVFHKKNAVAHIAWPIEKK